MALEQRDRRRLELSEELIVVHSHEGSPPTRW
jgi:hypothetical protein